MSAPGPGPYPASASASASADANLEDAIVDQFAKTDIRQSTPSEQCDIHAEVAVAAAAGASSSSSSSSAATKPAHNRRASTLGNDPFAYLQLYRNDTLAELEKYKDAVIVEPTYTCEEKAQMKELRDTVGAMIGDPEKMKCGPDDYPSGQHQHWTNYWPQGRDHPQFVDNYAHLDKDPSLWPEHELIRFLRARDYNMKKAVKMYFQYRRWRIVFGVTHLASFTTMPFEPLIQSILSHSYHKNDKSGRPLYIQRSGLIDPHRFSTEVSLEQISIGHTWFSEEMAKRAELGSRITGKRVTQLVNIIDIKDVGLAARKMLKIFSTTSHIDQNFYPETLGALYIINSPSFFPVFWNICKTFLAPKTQEKVNIIGSNYGPILLEALGPDCLPVEYGGQCVCEGGCCPSATGPNYVRPGEDSAEEENFTIKAGSSVTHEISYQHLISYPEDEGGDELQECWYNIDLSAKDIDYSITFTPSVKDGSAPVEVIPLTRISHGQPTTGIYSASQSGMIRILLSNEYSRWSSKAVKLRYGTRPKQGQQ